MKPSSIIVILIAITAVGLSVFLISAEEPEEVTVKSSDGLVEIMGLTRESQPITIKSTSTVESDYLVGAQYQIEPSAIVLDQPVDIYFDVSNYENSENLVVYRFNEFSQMWEQLELMLLYENDLIIYEDQLGTFALGYYVEVDQPNFLTQYDELLTMAPDKAVGYELMTGFQIDDDPLIILPDTKVIGGCGGILNHGNREEKSLLQTEARVLINDVETLAKFSFVARWFVNDVEGCAEDQKIEQYQKS